MRIAESLRTKCANKQKLAIVFSKSFYLDPHRQGLIPVTMATTEQDMTTNGALWLVFTRRRSLFSPWRLSSMTTSRKKPWLRLWIEKKTRRKQCLDAKNSGLETRFRSNRDGGARVEYMREQASIWWRIHHSVSPMVMQSGFDGSGEEKTPRIIRIGRDQQ